MFVYVSDELKNDKELALLAIGKKPSMFQHVSDELKNDRELALLVVEKDLNLFPYISDELKKDIYFILLVVERDVKSFRYIAPSLKRDPHFVELLCRKNIQFDPAFLKDSDMIVEKLVRKNIVYYQYFSDQWKEDHRANDLARRAVAYRGYFIRDVPPSLRTPELIDLALQQSAENRKYLGDVKVLRRNRTRKQPLKKKQQSKAKKKKTVTKVQVTDVTTKKWYKTQEESDPTVHMFRSILRFVEQKIRNTYISTLNVGIEIETCIFSDGMNLASFEETTDSTIKCRDGMISREFVYFRHSDEGRFFVDTDKKQWAQLERDMQTLNANRQECLEASCGLHYHISSEQLRKEILHPNFVYCFGYVLFYAWNYHYQHEFYHRFSYQRRRYGNTYANPNKRPSHNYNIDFETTFHDNDTQYRPYLTFVKDDTYFHVEFRGLSPDIQRFLSKEIQEFIAEVKRMYNVVYHIAFDLWHYTEPEHQDTSFRHYVENVFMSSEKK